MGTQVERHSNQDATRVPTLKTRIYACDAFIIMYCRVKYFTLSNSSNFYSKEYCRLISQNILGRESYFHTTRVIANDSLGTHSALERHAKSIKKQRLMMQYPVDGFTVSFL